MLTEKAKSHIEILMEVFIDKNKAFTSVNIRDQLTTLFGILNVNVIEVEAYMRLVYLDNYNDQYEASDFNRGYTVFSPKKGHIFSYEDSVSESLTEIDNVQQTDVF